ncbi:tail fiber/spike domain-containing protein [Enterobacter asburiae]|nr:hypothetical protein [Enterobacter asburiae]MBL5960078.1 hypothetical protein [Enterobacter asburiae]
MTTYNTGNPIGSTDPRDLYDNAQNFDHLSLDTENETWPDRLGNQRSTWYGIEKKADRAISGYGYITKKSFEIGATLDTPNTVLQWENNGEFYRWDGDWSQPKVVPPASTPDSTGGIGKGKWVGVTDASLRSDLNQDTGAGLSRTTSGKTVQEEIDAFKYGYKTPDDFGAVGGDVIKDTAAIIAAIAYCSPLGIPLRIPAKQYIYDGGTITLPIAIIGDRVPDYNASTNTMTNGSQIIGGIRFSAKNVVIENIGFKRPTGSPGDCLVLSTNNAAGASARVRNIVVAGLSPTNAYHSCLIEGYDAVHVSGVTAAYNLFGVAIKSRNVIARGIVTISCDTGVIIKSDSNFSTAKNVILDDHINIGNGVSSQGVWVYSTTAQLERVTCSNLQSTGTAIHMRIKSENVANDVQVNNANYSGSTYADVLVEGTAAGTLYNVSLNNITAVNSQKFMAAGFCEQLMVTGFYGSLKNGAPADTSFEVSNAVGLFNGANIQLVRQYGSDLMTMNLGNSYLNNRLSSIKAKVIGSGKPRPGYKEQNLTGTNATMIVGDSLGASGVVSVSATTSGSSFASIAINDDYGQPVRPGFLLIIRNAATISFVMRHNPGTGGIANNGAADKTLSGGDTMMYVFDGANWRQTPSI